MKELLSAELASRSLKRMTHEMIEQNQNLSDIVLVGILKKGVPIAYKIQENIKRFSDVLVPVYELNISHHRDDVKTDVKQLITIDIEDKNVIIVDDVLYTGRSVRAAMDALIDRGRPKRIQLAVLIDRGHRELPIRADFVGKNIPTSKQEKVVIDIENFSVYVTSDETPYL